VSAQSRQGAGDFAGLLRASFRLLSGFPLKDKVCRNPASPSEATDLLQAKRPESECGMGGGGERVPVRRSACLQKQPRLGLASASGILDPHNSEERRHPQSWPRQHGLQHIQIGEKVPGWYDIGL